MKFAGIKELYFGVRGRTPNFLKLGDFSADYHSYLRL